MTKSGTDHFTGGILRNRSWQPKAPRVAPASWTAAALRRFASASPRMLGQPKTSPIIDSGSGRLVIEHRPAKAPEGWAHSGTLRAPPRLSRYPARFGAIDAQGPLPGELCRPPRLAARSDFYLTIRFPPPIIQSMAKSTILEELPKHTRKAVGFYWQTRTQQVEKQRQAGASDQGLRFATERAHCASAFPPSRSDCLMVAMRLQPMVCAAPCSPASRRDA
jgi:hypothetical protein